MSAGWGTPPAPLRRRRNLRLVGLGAVLAAAVLLALAVGAVSVSPGRIVTILYEQLASLYEQLASGAAAAPADAHARIVWEIRLPRVLLAALVGGSLAAAGTVFQGLFRNPMADPYVIGVSSGASLGAAVGFLLPVGIGIGVAGFGAVPILAFVGALGAVVLVHGLARTNGQTPVMTLLLAGIATATVFNAVVSLVIYFSGERLRPIAYWMLGSLAGAAWGDVGLVAAYTAVGLTVLFAGARGLNALLAGEEGAYHLGVDVERLKRLMLAAGALTAAAAVSVSGIIGFVGLIVPHAVRLLVGPDHRLLLPAATLSGATFLVLTDTVARTIIAPTELPVGILTALAGGPFFLYLLRRRGRSLRGL